MTWQIPILPLQLTAQQTLELPAFGLKKIDGTESIDTTVMICTCQHARSEHKTSRGLVSTPPCVSSCFNIPLKSGSTSQSASSLHPGSSPTMSIFDRGGSSAKLMLYELYRKCLTLLNATRTLDQTSESPGKGNCAILLPREVMSSVGTGMAMKPALAT